MKSKYYLLLLVFMLFMLQISGQEVVVVTDSTCIPLQEIEEVEVKSAKQVQKKHKLPVSVSHLSGKTIENKEISSIKGLSARVPNFFMPDYGSKLTSPVYIRGIGSRINSPSVGLYIDHVPHFEKSAFDVDFYEIERIEVLRGPQGTLFGRNTMGGIINIYTRFPMEIRKTSVTAKTGNYGYYKTTISHNQPAGEKFGVGIYGNYLVHGGYYQNEHNNTKVDEMRSYSGRLRLLYKPAKNMKLDYVASFENSKQGGYPYALYNDSLQTAPAIDYNRNSTYDRQMLTNNLFYEMEKGKFVFTSNTSHQYLSGNQDIDQDFTPATLLFVQQDEQQHTFSEEIILKTAEKNSMYQWMVGGFGFYQLFNKQVHVDYGEDGIATFGLPFPMEKMKYYNQNNAGLAAFHQSTLCFFDDKLAVTGGIRLDYEFAKLDYQYDLDMNGNVSTRDSFVSRLEFPAFMPKIALRYSPFDQVNAYISVTSGYKSGGFNSTFERDEDRSFGPEESTNFEAGVKTNWWKKRIFASLAVFYIDWDNQQIYQPVPSGQGSMLKNAGESESKGVEVEINAIPVKNLNLFGNFGLTEAKFIDYQEDSLTDYSRNYIPYIPKYTASFGWDYRIPLKSEFLESVLLGTNCRIIGKHFWNEENDAYQDAYRIMNGKVSLQTKYFDIGLWGKNILGTEYHSFYFEAIGNQYVQIGKPRLIGVTAKVHF